VSTGAVGSFDNELGGGGGEVRSAVEWAQVRAMAADGVGQREIARRLGVNRRTVKRLAEASEPPRYERAPAGSMLDPLEPVIRRLLEEWPDMKAPRVTELLRDDYGYAGSVDLVRRRIAAIRPRQARPAQRTGYRPGQVMQVDWAEMPTRPKIAGRERRVYALICALPFSGASTAHFSFEMTTGVCLAGPCPAPVRLRQLRSAVARRERDVVTWNPRFVQLRGHYAFHATACMPATPREKGAVEGAVRHHKTSFWPARRFRSLAEFDEPLRRLARPRRAGAPPRHWPLHRRRAPGRRARGAVTAAADRVRRGRTALVAGAAGRYLKHAGSFYRVPEALVHQRVELRFDRDSVWIEHRGQTVAGYARSYLAETWQMRPEPPTDAPVIPIAAPQVVPAALSDYAELCA
jgi:transposase